MENFTKVKFLEWAGTSYMGTLRRNWVVPHSHLREQSQLELSALQTGRKWSFLMEPITSSGWDLLDVRERLQLIKISFKHALNFIEVSLPQARLNRETILPIFLLRLTSGSHYFRGETDGASALHRFKSFSLPDFSSYFSEHGVEFWEVKCLYEITLLLCTYFACTFKCL